VFIDITENNFISNDVSVDASVSGEIENSLEIALSVWPSKRKFEHHSDWALLSTKLHLNCSKGVFDQTSNKIRKPLTYGE